MLTFSNVNLFTGQGLFCNLVHSLYPLTFHLMKKFMQLILASFGVVALMLAGCSTTPAEETPAMEEDASMTEETPVVEVETSVTEEAPAMEEATEEEGA